jgi:nitrosocyanin
MWRHFIKAGEIIGGVRMALHCRGILVVVFLTAALSLPGSPARAEEKVDQFTIVNVEYEGTKMWLPGTMVVHKGDKVKVRLINNVKSDPNQHGFTIPAYNIAVVVTRGEPATLDFVADRVGIFPIACQLHPGHVGGQLVVIE